MKYNVLLDDRNQDLFSRLMQVRNIEDDLERFLDPSYEAYRTDPWTIHDMEAGIERICSAIQHNEKIMIFGDYDVDGIMSSYILFTFFQKFLNYKQISVRLPHRVRDGYGIKTHHIDEIASLGCKLIITVDNGTTSFQEALHATSLGVDMVITDHHKPLDELPQAHALINPHLSTHDGFKEICGATVAFKVCMALADKLITDRTVKKQMHERLLPFVSIATVGDCMPLVNENRLLVKKGLDLINTKRYALAPALRQFLDYLNIKEMDSYHIGFMIGPRLNATGRVGDPIDGLMSLLTNHPEQQLIQLQKMDELNTERRKTQDMMSKHARELIDPDKMLLFAMHEEFHEGIVGIVAGRLTEKHNKPSLVMGVNTYDKIATGSLRGPSYFNVVEMLKTADDLLIRYGGHEQAGGMTVHLDDLDEVLERFQSYCEEQINSDDLEKTISIDTHLYEHELQEQIMEQVLSFGPYGEGNPEPLFLLENTVITKAEQVGRGERTHLKLHCKKDTIPFSVMQRGKGEMAYETPTDQELNIIGKVKKDTFNGGFYVEGKHILDARN